jgi:hypothetical protein
MPTPPQPAGNSQNEQIRCQTPQEGDHSGIMEPLHSQLLLCKEEGWETQTSLGLQTPQQMDQKELKYIPTHLLNH